MSFTLVEQNFTLDRYQLQIDINKELSLEHILKYYKIINIHVQKQKNSNILLRITRQKIPVKYHTAFPLFYEVNLIWDAGIFILNIVEKSSLLSAD